MSQPGSNPPIVHGQAVVLRAIDPKKREVVLLGPRWHNKIKLDHAITLEVISDTITDPKLIHVWGNLRRYYREGDGNNLILVAVGPYQGIDQVVTAFPCKHVKNWELGAKYEHVRTKQG